MHSLKLQGIRAGSEALKNDNSVFSQPSVQRDNELRQLEEWRAELLTIRLDDLEQEAPGLIRTTLRCAEKLNKEELRMALGG
jgi:hypothetical protein